MSKIKGITADEAPHFPSLVVIDEILSLELLADMEDDLDKPAKAKRLRRQARALRKAINFHLGTPTLDGGPSKDIK